MTGGRVSDVVSELRRAFDERFAAPVGIRAEAPERLLLVGLDGARVALRIPEIAGVHASGRVVRVPGGAPGFIGMAGVRGRVVPVFDLAALVGAGAAGVGRRWIVVAGGGDRVGLLVADVEGYVEIGDADVLAVADRARALRHARGLARVAGALVPIVDLPSVLGEIAARARRG